MAGHGLVIGLYPPDLGQFNRKVGQENQPCAIPLLLGRGYFLLARCQLGLELSEWTVSTHVLDLVFVQEGEAVNDDPGQRAAKVNNLMHDKGHDAGGKDIVLHEGVPCRP